MRNFSYVMASTFVGSMLVLGGCGKAKDTVDAASNEVRIKGNWVMTETDKSGTKKAVAEADSVVLTFKDGKVAYSPINNLANKAAYLLEYHSSCKSGPRPYKVDGNNLRLEAVAGCAEVVLPIQRLDNETLIVADTDNINIVHTYGKADDARYYKLVQPTDRKL